MVKSAALPPGDANCFAFALAAQRESGGFKVLQWAQQNPDGWIIFYPDNPHPPEDSPVYWQPYRSGSIEVRPAAQVH